MQVYGQLMDDFKENQADALAHGFITPRKDIITFCTKNDIVLVWQGNGEVYIRKHRPAKLNTGRYYTWKSVREIVFGCDNYDELAMKLEQHRIKQILNNI